MSENTTYLEHILKIDTSNKVPLELLNHPVNVMELHPPHL